jgi:hypothetical protein
MTDLAFTAPFELLVYGITGGLFSSIVFHVLSYYLGQLKLLQRFG